MTRCGRVGEAPARPPGPAPARKSFSRNARGCCFGPSRCACALGSGAGPREAVGYAGRGERSRRRGARLQVPGSRPRRGAWALTGRALAKRDHFPARAPVPLLCSAGKSGADERKALPSRAAPWSEPSGLDVPDYYCCCCLYCEHEIPPQGLLPRPLHLLLPPVVTCY